MVGGYNRKISYDKAVRKQKLDKLRCGDYYFPYYSNLHEYSKGKIHCSCGNCSTKTRNKGDRRTKHANYSNSINYKKSDLIKMMDMDSQEEEFFT